MVTTYTPAYGRTYLYHTCKPHERCFSWWKVPVWPSIHSAVRLTAGTQLLSKRVLHRVRSSASSFNLQCLLFSLRPFSSCLHLLSRLPVTSILPSIFLRFDTGSIFLDIEDCSQDSNANASRYEIPLPVRNCFEFKASWISKVHNSIRR